VLLVDRFNCLDDAMFGERNQGAHVLS